MMDAQGEREVGKIGSHCNGVEGFLSVYSDVTKVAANSLISDERMNAYWGSKFFEPDFIEAVHNFELAHSRLAWDGLSRREQAKWLVQFDKTIAKLLELLRTAPRPPEHWGFPVRMGALVEAAERMGVKVPGVADIDGRFSAELRLEEAVDPMGWTIVDSLQHFQRQQHVDAVVDQPLAKPRDAKAARAFFLTTFQKYRPNVSAAVVATVASVMFREEVDDRKVREHRPDGLLRNRRNPS